MIANIICQCILMYVSGVFGGQTQEVKTVSVIEGDSVTLTTDVKVQKEDQILWRFGHADQIAEIIQRNRLHHVFVSNDDRFRDKLHLDNQTGSLTISNIRPEHSGLYLLQINREQMLLKSFNVTLYAPLPSPVIMRDFSHCSSSSPGCSSVPKCLLMCSVMNVSHVTLSWYKGNCLLSSTSVSGLSTSLSLSLEIQCLDDSYRCTVAYPFINRTEHLNVNDLCLSCLEHRQHAHFILLITSVFVLLALIVVAVLKFCTKKRCEKFQILRKTDKGKNYFGGDCSVDDAGFQKKEVMEVHFCTHCSNPELTPVPSTKLCTPDPKKSLSEPMLSEEKHQANIGGKNL